MQVMAIRWACLKNVGISKLGGFLKVFLSNSQNEYPNKTTKGHTQVHTLIRPGREPQNLRASTLVKGPGETANGIETRALKVRNRLMTA